jgi:hypothetical protein
LSNISDVGNDVLFTELSENDENYIEPQPLNLSDNKNVNNIKLYSVNKTNKT